MTSTVRTANVALGYSDLTRLISELDARAHDLGRYAEEARRHGDKRQASTHLERREEVLRLREYLHVCARTLVAAAEREPGSDLASASTSPSEPSR